MPVGIVGKMLPKQTACWRIFVRLVSNTIDVYPEILAYDDDPQYQQAPEVRRLNRHPKKQLQRPSRLAVPASKPSVMLYNNVDGEAVGKSQWREYMDILIVHA